MSRWSEADIDKLREKGIRHIDTRKPAKPVWEPTVLKPVKPASFALGRMKAGKMNKTEAAYAGHLEALKIGGEVMWYQFEAINLRLGENCYYRPDFLVMLKSGELQCHEVKGYWQEDALVKIRTAAEKFPFRFIAIKLVKGKWEVREF